MTYTVRLAQAEHGPLLPAIERAAGALFPEEDLPPDVADELTSLDDFAEAQAVGRLWVALDVSGAPVGFALAELVDGGAHLAELDVHPDHGRQGLGSRLVTAVRAWAGAEGHATVTLTTFSHLPWNRPLYERLGFRVLEPGELGPQLADLLCEELESGLRNRVAMIARATV